MLPRTSSYFSHDDLLYTLMYNATTLYENNNTSNTLSSSSHTSTNSPITVNNNINNEIRTEFLTFDIVYQEWQNAFITNNNNHHQQQQQQQDLQPLRSE
eukprot:UN08698